MKGGFYMQTENRIYVAIDLKSFYASVECQERGLDPLNTNLVVADVSRTEKTICLAVSPTLKAYGISGRARLFEVVAKVKEINAMRKSRAPGRTFTGSSYNADELAANPSLELAYIAATPRMNMYMQCSTTVYSVYLKYIAPEDIHVYSIDEVFMDVTQYLKTYGMTARELTKKMISEVQNTTGITATAGIGTNLYLCKVAMDIMAKHVKADADGVRIAELDEYTYRKELWTHRPLTDFWRVGHGYSKKLEQAGLMTMGDIARCSIGNYRDFYNEKLLYDMFGINAELLIDHAWGWEPCTIEDVKAYKPENNSISSGQVLQSPYTHEKTRLIVMEMTDLLVLDLVQKKLVTDQLVLSIGYDVSNLSIPIIRKNYKGPVVTDHFGKEIPKHSHGTVNLKEKTSSSKIILDAVSELFDRIANPILLSRRINICAANVVNEEEAKKESYEQIDLFSYVEEKEDSQKREEDLKREKKMQEAMLEIKNKYGKNAILKGMNLQKGGMTIERNKQVGGHKA